jgi:ATP-dependent RNA helicase DeaD
LHPSDDAPQIKSFDHWALGPDVLGVIEDMGIEVPTPIQSLAIGPVLEGRDVIAKAETGTGKTLAFGAPMIARIDPGRSTVLGLILCPTRELAQQVASVLEKLSQPRGIRVALVVGGDPMHGQVQMLQQGAQVVVGTPGRVLDLYGQGFLSFPWTEYVVLDEADEMLEIGFIDDVKKILSFTPDERQTLLFSATFPHTLLRLARESTRNPAEIATASGVATVDTIEQSWMKIDTPDRVMALVRIIEQSGPEDVLLVFCDRRTEVDSLMRRLDRLPFSIKALHGGYDQPSRFRVMSAFRTGEVKALVATDVASRGLDVAHVTHVINYSVPQDVSDYTHRIGRTGRAGRSGAAITLVTPEKASLWRAIRNNASWEIREVDPPTSSRTRGSRREPPRTKAPPRSSPGPAATATEPESRPGQRSRGQRESRPHRGREGRERESQPNRGREGRERERQPSRERESRERGSRPSREREGRRRESRPGRERESSPDRERADSKPARESKPEKREQPGSFGAGL